jgi:hypothetical protein
MRVTEQLPAEYVRALEAWVQLLLAEIRASSIESILRAASTVEEEMRQYDGLEA